MRGRNLLVLLAVVAALGAFIWFYERELPSTEERAEQGRKLVVFDEDSVRSIVLVAQERKVRFERVRDTNDSDADISTKEEWRLVEPLQGRADQDEVEALLDRIRELETQRTLEDVSEEQVGLVRPRAELELEIASGLIRIRFGGEIPASKNTVAEVGEGPPFFVVSGELVDDIARDPDGWRSRDALAFDEGEIEKLEILEPAGGVVLERTGDEFRLLGPVQDLADKTRVSELLQELVDLEIEKFLGGESQASLAFAPVVIRLTVAGVAEPVLVEVERTVDGASMSSMVRVGGELFEAETDLASMLERSPAEWRSTDWSSLRVFEIESFRMTRRGGADLTLELRDGDWRLGERAIEYAVAGDFLRAATGAKGTPIEGDAKRGTGSPDIEIELRSIEGSESLRLWSAGGPALVERAGRSARLELDGDSALKLANALERLEAAAERDSGDLPG